MGAIPAITLVPGASRRLATGHPWVFANTVRKVAGDPAPGALVRVAGPDGRRVGEGFYSPASRVRVRLITGAAEPLLDGEEPLLALLRQRLAEASALREGLGFTGGYRLAFGESDGLPGLVVDRYGRTLVVQLLSAGMEARRTALVEMLNGLFAPEAIVERSDTGGREREGLAPARGVLAGILPEGGRVPFEAEGLALEADVLDGQKTGFYLDQRDNWTALRAVARGKKVLDACCYTGAFGLSLLRGGAESLLGVDSSHRAVAAAEASAGRNGFTGRASFVAGDAGSVMAEAAKRGESFGFVVLDPPALARTKAHRSLALRAYRALNAAALSVTARGGFLFTCSCTPWVGAAELAEMVGEECARAGRRPALVETRGQARDHTAHPAMPETRYLTGLLVNVQ